MANHGRKLAILFNFDKNGETYIWCIEATVERRVCQREIWEDVVWSKVMQRTPLQA